LARLDEKDGKYFAGQVRSWLSKDREQQAEVALELTLCSGGSDASRLIEEILNSSDRPTFRANMLAALSGTNGWYAFLDRIPISSELEQKASALCKSSDPMEVCGGLGLLGNVPSEESRQVIVSILLGSESTAVKRSALWALGRQGMEGTDKILTTFSGMIDAMPQSQQDSLRKWLDFAFQELAARRSQ
jgi:hypothetical protein